MDTPSRDELPAELRAFLYTCIDAVEQLEILMLLRRSGRAWTAREVTRELDLAEAVTRRHLETLTSRGLLAARPGDEVSYRFFPKTEALAHYAALLAEHYATSRSAVHRFVAKGSGSKRFSDAFKLRDQEP